jgi:hypothetical protein
LATDNVPFSKKLHKSTEFQRIGWNALSEIGFNGTVEDLTETFSLWERIKVSF